LEAGSDGGFDFRLRHKNIFFHPAIISNYRQSRTYNCGGKVPNPNIQAPEKSQIQNSKSVGGYRCAWSQQTFHRESARGGNSLEAGPCREIWAARQRNSGPMDDLFLFHRSVFITKCLRRKTYGNVFRSLPERGVFAQFAMQQVQGQEVENCETVSHFIEQNVKKRKGFQSTNLNNSDGMKTRDETAPG
jgi:hypothetical protein